MAKSATSHGCWNKKTENMDNLYRKTILGFAKLPVGFGIFVLVPAGTLDFWQAWVYFFVFAASTALITAYLWNKDPKLLERRINAGPGAEKEKSQKLIMFLVLLAFAGVIIVPALDRRFSWSDVPPWVVIAGDVLVALGFFITFIVLKENPFASATIEVAPGQRVISTGPYAIVRHPMYSGGLLIIFGTPLALGSWWGLLICVSMTPMLVWRILEEESFLSKNLSGYKAYCQTVRYRLAPFFW
ncbi:MAG: isoprenylcysteine carboxylmethyltransferase family protein [Syntrophobacteraceae bacterium]